MDAQRGIARRMVTGLPKDGLSPAWEKDFAAYPPAGVIVFRRDFHDLEDLRALTARLRHMARPRRIFIAMDEEGGWVSQLAGRLVVPPNARLLARGAAPGDIRRISEVTGRRLRALGVDWTYAPVADVNSEPRNPVIGPRAFGDSPDAVSRCVGEALAGLRAAGMASCLKHFPGHGDTIQDSHLDRPRSRATREQLDALALPPFRDNLAAADAVMTAHVVYDALDGDSPGTFSRAVARDLLRDTLGFKGICVTDAMEMKGAALGHSRSDAFRLALDAGCDLLLDGTGDDLRRTRLGLAKALVDDGIDRTGFDAARPRLAAFDRDHPEPTEAELAQPLEALTPKGWTELLEAIIERGVTVKGRLPGSAAGLPFRVAAPEFADGPPVEDELASHGVALTTEAGGAVNVFVVCSRVPLDRDAIERMRETARAQPTVLVGLQNDVFLDDVPEAAMRISACDATPLARRVVARLLAANRHGANEART